MWKGRLVRVAWGSVPCLAIQLQIGNNSSKLVVQRSDQVPGHVLYGLYKVVFKKKKNAGF